MVSAVRRRYGQITLFIFTKSVPNAKETPNGSGGKPKPNKSGHSPRSPTVSPLHSFSLPSHPHQARFYRCALICFIVSFIWLCLTPFTAAPRICGLPFTYRVSAVRFAWLCGEDWLYCPLNFKFPNKKSPRSTLGLFHAYMTLFLFKIAGIICIYRFTLCKNNNRHNVQS